MQICVQGRSCSTGTPWAVCPSSVSLQRQAPNAAFYLVATGLALDLLIVWSVSLVQHLVEMENLSNSNQEGGLPFLPLEIKSLEVGACSLFEHDLSAESALGSLLLSAPRAKAIAG